VGRFLIYDEHFIAAKSKKVKQLPVRWRRGIGKTTQMLKAEWVSPYAGYVHIVVLRVKSYSQICGSQCVCLKVPPPDMSMLFQTRALNVLLDITVTTMIALHHCERNTTNYLKILISTVVLTEKLQAVGLRLKRTFNARKNYPVVWHVRASTCSVHALEPLN